MTKNSTTHPVIYFDGECNLCNGFVEYVINHDPDAFFRFSSLQSKYARSRGFEIQKTSDGSLESMLVEWNGEILNYSEGVLRVFRHLNGVSKALAVFRIIPKPIRDAIYRWVARHRYFFFGKSEFCLMPTPELEARFLG